MTACPVLVFGILRNNRLWWSPQISAPASFCGLKAKPLMSVKVCGRRSGRQAVVFH